MTLLAIFCLFCALLPTGLYVWNYTHFRPPPPLPTVDTTTLPTVSVLIPARNEEENIAACIDSVLTSRGVQLEVIVLDDHSTDKTAESVLRFAERDKRVRLVHGEPLPDGWCGKQYACYQLAHLARYEYLAFLDADVRLHPEALGRMIGFLEECGAGLVSGFPRQVTQTWLEKLVLPLIHWILLGFLPLAWMRRWRLPSLGAGCGQLFVTTRKAYQTVGGHAVIRRSRHDGLTLPRAYRRAGFHTDIADITDLASCRMYHSASQLWQGLAKNATEGMAHPTQIGFWTIILLCGQIIPFAAVPLLTGLHLITPAQFTDYFLGYCLFSIATLLAILIRLDMARRFRHSWMGAIFHPLGIFVLLAIQWYALVRQFLGLQVAWRGRTAA